MSVWEEIKDRLDIEQVIGQYIQLSSYGTNLKARCPFHSEKSASFMVSKPKQIWHCFGCGLGGDVFGFVAEIENISRGEALQKLAKQAGVNLENKIDTSVSGAQVSPSTTDQNTNQSSKDSYFSTGLKHLSWAADLYNQILQKELAKPKSEVKDYILKRGITQEQIQIFKLGYAPDIDLLLDLSSKKKGLNLRLLLATGLLVDKSENQDNQSEKLRDKFKHRLMIPISNDKGQIVGFTGRFLGSDPNRPKYLNSPQTSWFNKGEILFGLDLIRKNVYLKKEVILVEGHLDLISAYTKGFNNIVASGGTSITETQIRKIKRLSTNLTLGLDNDEAGLVAAHKTFIQATKMGLNVNQLVIPSKYKDLDEYVQDSDQNKAPLDTEFYLDYYLSKNQSKINSNNTQTQKNAIIQTLELINVLDPISKEQYLNKLSNLSKISTQTLKTTLETSFEQSKNFNSKPLSDENLKDEVKNVNDRQKLINLKVWLSLYQNLKNYPLQNDFQNLVIKSWEILFETSLLPSEISYNLEEVLQLHQNELQLIWDEDLQKKIYLRPEYPKEIIRTIDSLILNRRQMGILSLNLNEKMYEYDMLRQRVLNG